MQGLSSTGNGLSALARKPIALGRALAGRGWEVVRPVHQVLPLQGPVAFLPLLKSSKGQDPRLFILLFGLFEKK